MPFVSIIVPTFNRAHLLMRCIESIRQQTFHDWELLIVDDGSTDNTIPIINELLKRDTRIQLIRLPKNRGVAHARNVGIEAARSEWVAFNDSDDEWLPEKLERQIRWIEKIRREQHREPTVVYTWYKTQTSEGETTTNNGTLSGNLYSQLLNGYFVSPITMMIKRSVCHDVGLFDTSFIRGSDHDFLLRVAQQHAFDVLPEVLSIEHRHDGPAITANPEHFGFFIHRYRQEILSVGGRKLLADHLAYEASLFAEKKRTRQATNCYLKSIVTYPFKRWTWRRLAGTTLGPTWKKLKSCTRKSNICNNS